MSVEDPPFPIGVPTACFVRLDDGPNPSATAATDAGGGKVAIDGRPHEMDAVFDSRLDKDGDVFQAVLQIAAEENHRPVPLLTFVEDAVSVCAIFTGTNVSGKRDLYQGSDDDDDSLGVLGWVFDPMFQLLRDKAFGMQGFYEFDVDVAFYEIFDEMITDLLRPDNQDLQVKLHPVRGFEVEGLSRTPIASPQDGRRAVQAGKRNRRTQILPNGPAQESASAVLQIGLTQREGESQEQYAHLHSVALLVEAPSTHKLVSSADDLRLTQGPTLNRSLLAFKEVAKALASEKQIRFAPFADGRLTEAIQCSLGGNAVVLVVACFSRSDTIKVNTTTMAVVRNLQAAMHYPVSNTELIQGLVQKYQFMLANSMGGRAAAAGSDGAVNAQRMRALEGQVLQAKMESNESKEDAAKVYKMLELFKAKYVKLVETKSSQSLELINAEEEKLDVSRCLLDLKLEHSKLLERFETDRYALTTDLLAAKNEVVELEMGLQESEASRASKQREATAAVADREAMQEKLFEAQKRVKELQENFGVEEAKSIEMGAELLTLVNQKAHLDAVREDLERQVEDFSARLRMLELDLRTAREETRVLKQESEEARKKAEFLEIAKAKAELDLQRAQVEWETRTFDHHRAAVSGEQTREAELLKNHMNDLEELTKIKAENEDLNKMRESLRLNVKQGERRWQQSQEECARTALDLTESQRELAEVTAELDELRHKFRDKMETFAAGGKGAKKGLRRKEYTADAGEEKAERGKRAALEEMVASYKDREEKAIADAEALREQARDAKLKNRALFDRCKQLRGIIEDSVGEQSLPPDLPPDDQLIAAGAAGASAAGVGVSDGAETAALKARLKIVSSELSSQQEKHVNVVEEYSELIKSLEQKQRDDALQIGRLEADNLGLTRQAENANGGQQMQAMQAMVEKMAAGPSGRDQTTAGGAGSKDTRISIRLAEDERDRALDEVALLRQKRGSAGGGNHSQDLIEELKRAERRNAELVSSNTTLEAELTHFKSYMRETVARYQATISQLQAELKQAKGG